MGNYYLCDGTQVSADTIKAAVKYGRARLVHSHGDGKTLTSLALDGVDIDTTGECYSMWDEVWTTTPKTVLQALAAARS